MESRDGRHTRLLSQTTSVRPGTVDKFLCVRHDQTVIYSRHLLTGMTGPITVGHHPMLKFSGADGAGLVSTSPLRHAQVAPLPFETPAQGGYQSLLPGAVFTRLDRVPQQDGGCADLTRYPARRGFEDLVLLVHQSRADFGWSAVVFPADGYGRTLATLEPREVVGAPLPRAGFYRRIFTLPLHRLLRSHKAADL